jgi:pyrroline-5-carboxylate reductase
MLYLYASMFCSGLLLYYDGGCDVEKRIGFIGCGNIAEAIIKGLLNAGYVSKMITATNKEKTERLKYIKETYGVQVSRDKKEVVDNSDLIILAVKPKDVVDALRDIQIGDRILISVAAGITTEYLGGMFKDNVRVIRAMPNTSSMVGESVTAICRGRFASDDDLNCAYEVFSSIGEVAILDEEYFDIVTGLSGSGPAYIYYMMEALVEAGIKSGLDAGVAQELARQTIFGAAVMLKKTGEDPSRLRLNVTSPGGTTMAGIMALESRGFKEIIYNAVYEASRRSKEMRESIGA